MSTSDADIDSLDLWGDLEQEFQEHKVSDSEVKLQLGEPPQRRFSVVDKLRQTAFNGFALALLVCLAVVLPWFSSNPLVACLTLVAAVPLAGVMAHVFGGVRRHLAWYAGAAVLAAGTYSLVLAVLHGATGHAVSTHGLKSGQVLHMVQSTLETYLQASHWLGYILVGCLAAFALFRYQAKRPWLDARERSRGARYLAVAVILSPLWFALGSFTLYQWQSQTEVGRWLDKVEPALEESPPLVYVETPPAWERVRRRWRLAAGGPEARNLSDEALHKRTSTELLHRTEDELKAMLLKIELGDNLRFNGYYTLRSLMFSRVEDLQDPFAVVEAFLLLDSDSIWADLSAEALLKLVNRPGAARAQLESALETLKTARKKAIPTLESLDRLAYGMALSRAMSWNEREAPRPLKAFGHEVPGSPTQLYFRQRALAVAHEWVHDLRPRLEKADYKEYHTILGPSTRYPWSDLPDHQLAAESVRDRVDNYVPEKLEMAQVATAARLFKLNEGRWPRGLAELESSLDFQPQLEDWELKVVGGELRITNRVLLSHTEGNERTWGSQVLR